MDVKRIGFIATCVLVIALLVVFLYQLDRSEPRTTSIDLETLVATELPEGWELMEARQQNPDSISLYIVTNRDALVTLELNTCVDLDGSSSVTQCLERKLDFYLPTQDDRDAAKINTRPASNSNLDGIAAYVEILDARRSDFLIEVYKFQFSNGPFFATISLSDEQEDGYIHDVTAFLEEKLNKES